MKNLPACTIVILLMIAFPSYPQDQVSFRYELPESAQTGYYLERAKKIFEKYKILVTASEKYSITGVHNQKTITVMHSPDNPSGGYVKGRGYPAKALAKLLSNIYEYIVNAENIDLTYVPGIIEIETFTTTYYNRQFLSFYNENHNKIPECNYWSQDKIKVWFANLPVKADMIVIAKNASSPEKWIQKIDIFEGKFIASQPQSNSGELTFLPLPEGNYEVRVLSKLTSGSSAPNNYRILQHFTFDVNETGTWLVEFDYRPAHKEFGTFELTYKGNGKWAYKYISGDPEWSPEVDIGNFSITGNNIHLFWEDGGPMGSFGNYIGKLTSTTTAQGTMTNVYDYRGIWTATRIGSKKNEVLEVQGKWLVTFDYGQTFDDHGTFYLTYKENGKWDYKFISGPHQWSPRENFGNFSKTGNTIIFDWADGGHSGVYTGKLTSTNTAEGTMTTSLGYKGVWSAKKVE